MPGPNKSEISIHLKDQRLKLEPNATRFFQLNKTRLGVSYEAFIHYENGHRIPPVAYLRRVAPIIHSDFRTLCHLWTRAHMPDEESKSFFDGIPITHSNIPTRANHHEIYRFSRNDIKILIKHPQMFLLASFMGAYHSTGAISLEEIKRFSELPISKLTLALNEMIKMGLIETVRKNEFKSRYKDFEIPRDDEEFKNVRDNNFKLISGKVLKAFTTDKRNKGEAQRFTFTTLLDEEHQRIVQAKLTELELYLDSIPIKGNRLSSVCVTFSDYFSRENSK